MKDKLPKGEEVKKEITRIVTELRKEKKKEFEQRLYGLENLDGGIGRECLHMIDRTENMDLHLDAINLLCQDIWETCNGPKDPKLALEKVNKYTWAVATLAGEIEDAKKNILKSLCNVYDLIKKIHGWEADYRKHIEA
jgi:hypothetical protein